MLLRIGLVCVVVSSVVHAQRSGAAAPAAPSATVAAAPSAEVSGTGPGGGGQSAGAAGDEGWDVLIKGLEVQKWSSQLGDSAEVKEIRYRGAPPQKPRNPTGPGAKN